MNAVHINLVTGYLLSELRPNHRWRIREQDFEQGLYSSTWPEWLWSRNCHHNSTNVLTWWTMMLHEWVVCKYEGMDRFAARKAIVKDLEAGPLLVKIENIYTALTSQWTYVDVEPRLQTMVRKMGPRASHQCKHNVRKDNIVNFYPPRFIDAHYVDGKHLHDHCQLWWGHQTQLGTIKKQAKCMWHGSPKRQRKLDTRSRRIDTCPHLRYGHFQQWATTKPTTTLLSNKHTL